MLNKALALFALVFLIGFIGILIFFVAEPDLIIIAAGCLMLAAYDFYRALFSEKR